MSQIDVVISIITFLLGTVFGWFINHWYSVNMTMPMLKTNGGGSDRSLGSDFRSVHISIENELRHLGIRVPTTIILGKQLKTYFGNQVVERDTARKCTASLLDEDGKFISQLWWRQGREITPAADIKSGEQASMIVFVSKEGEEGYFPYQPISQSDFAPRITKIPRFDIAMNFSIIISYSFGSKSLNLPVKVSFNYDGNVYFEYGGGSTFFYERKMS